LVVATTVVSGSTLLAGEPPERKRQDRPSGYGFVNLGPYDVKEDLGVLGKASYEFQLAGGFAYHFNRYFAGELEMGVLGREHEVPEGLFPDRPTPNLGIWWLACSAVARFPVGRFEPFVGAGIGSGQAHLDFVSDSAPPSLEEIDDDRGVLFLYRAGFDAAVGKKHRVGMELRRMVFDADLGDFTGGETDIGGTGALFTYRYVF
jgi:opacity protein-like surface antigen